MIELRLSNGGVALIDDEDAHLARFKWSRMKIGYVRRREWQGGKERMFYLHREVLGLTAPNQLADHINRDKLDNRRTNLRVVTRAQNSQNKPTLGGSSRFRGVNWHRAARKWAAEVKLEGCKYYLGLYASELAAARAAEAFRREHMAFA